MTMREAGSGREEPARELEIDLLGLLRILVRRKLLFALAVILGLGGGLAAHRLLPKRYESGVSFAFQTQGGGNSRLQQLAALAGNVNLRQEGSPFVAHLKPFSKTREVTGRLMDLRYGDSTLRQILLGPAVDTAGKDIAYSFHSKVTSLYELLKEDEMYRLSVEMDDPAKARFLAQNLFDTISWLLEEKRREGIKKKLVFLDSLVNGYRMQYEASSNSKKKFQMENLDANSPVLAQRREQIYLQLKLDEEKYLLSVREREELRIRYQQSEEPLIVLEGAFIPQYPIFPSRTKCLLAGVALTLLLLVLAVGYRDRSAWIRGR